MPGITRVLLQTLFGAKARRKMASDYRFKGSQPVPQNTQVENGEPPVNLDMSAPTQLHNKLRSTGRLFSDTHSQRFQEVSEIPVPRQSLSVSGTPIQPLFSPLALHSDNGRGQDLGSPLRHLSLSLPGRLVSPDANILHGNRPRSNSCGPL